MRELKFRAWVSYGEKLEKPNYSLDYDCLDRFFEDNDENDTDQCIEQYTGLRDKNGKEIYEGDIVLNTYYDDGEIYKVLWVDDSVAFGMESLEDMELYKLPLESLKVIGNIHENPELLEKQ